VPEGIANDEVRESIAKGIAEQTMLGRPATLADVGNVAVFAASDWGRTLTATKLNITCGTVVD
jgi:enoyl-[acyl-carrier-protein] reductase (NADH)